MRISFSTINYTFLPLRFADVSPNRSLQVEEGNRKLLELHRPLKRKIPALTSLSQLRDESIAETHDRESPHRLRLRCTRWFITICSSHSCKHFFLHSISPPPKLMNVIDCGLLIVAWLISSPNRQRCNHLPFSSSTCTQTNSSDASKFHRVRLKRIPSSSILWVQCGFRSDVLGDGNSKKSTIQRKSFLLDCWTSLSDVEGKVIWETHLKLFLSHLS